MDVALLHTLYEAFAGDRSTFLYSGKFHDAHTARLIVLGEESTDDKENGKGPRTRLAFVLVEAYQNIIRHRAELPSALANGPGRSMLLWRAFATGHEVTTMNPVSHAEAAHVLEQLGGLDTLDPEELKKRYIESLKRDHRTERGGAGLGLIEMARRSGNALRHRMSTMDAEHQLFTLQVVVEPADPTPRLWASLEELHRKIVASDLLLFHKGLATQRMEEALERMVEQELADEPERARTAALALRSLAALSEPLGAGPTNSSLTLVRTPDGHSLIGGTLLDGPDADRLEAAFAGPGPTAQAPAPIAPNHLLQQLERVAQRPLVFERMASGNGLHLVLIALPV